MLTSSLLRASWRSWYSQDFRVVGPAWLQLVWTFVFCAIIALAFTLLGLGFNAARFRSLEHVLSRIPKLYWDNLVVSLVIGYLTHALIEGVGRLIGHARLRRQPRLVRTSFFVAMPVLGTVVGWPVGVWLVLGDLRQALPPDRPGATAGTITIVLLVSFAFFIYFDSKHRQIAAERQATEAQLRLLQAQIEPHFLFNTLANVLSLMDHDTPRAREMLESFIDYLRASIGGLRRDGHTLGDELALVEAYLSVVGIRMDDRLRWRIEVADDLRRAPLPALTLQPLVENAIVHGLEPKLEGGAVTVRASMRGDDLVIEVLDDGLGLPGPDAPRRHHAGTGTACLNIRERLLQLHGDGATLQVAAAPAGGVLATLTLPHSTATAA